MYQNTKNSYSELKVKTWDIQNLSKQNFHSKNNF